MQKQQAADAAQTAAAGQQVSQAQMDNFRKAFSACLEGKQYIVKY